MEKALLAIAQAYVRAKNVEDGLLSWIKKVIAGGFENHKIADSDLPGIQVIYKGSTVEDYWVWCTKMKALFNIHLVYNARKFTDEGAVVDGIQKIDTTLLISNQVEKRINCEYDPTSVCWVVLANQDLVYDLWLETAETVGYGFVVENIEYGTYQRGSWSTYPTGEAIVSTSLLYKV